jgi:hypothetical protein
MESGIVEADVELLMGLSRQLANTVRRREVSPSTISCIFDEIEGMVQLRKAIRRDERVLRGMEREIELGVGCKAAYL